MHVTDDANDGQKAEIAVHVSEFNGVTHGILPWPALARQGCADDRNVRRVGAVALVKDSPANETNSKRLKISLCRDAKIGFPQPLFLTEEDVEILG